MKACVLHGIGRLIYEDVPDPIPKTGEVLLKIKASGICGSDISRVFKKGTYSFPTIPGHEFAGEIVDIGKGVSSSLIGKSAAVFPLLPCFSCNMCETGEYASCGDYNYFGSRCDGGFAEYIAVPVWNLVMCDGLSYEEMAMAEPAAVSLHALRRAGAMFGDTVAIFGAGAIGLMTAAFAKASGASKVILFDIDNKKLEFAKQIGWEYVQNPVSDKWLEEFKNTTDGKGADLSIEASGSPQAACCCFKTAKPLSRVVLMGNPEGDMNLKQDAYWEILRKQLTIFGTWNSSYTSYKNDWRDALDAFLTGKADVKPLVTHRFDLTKHEKAFCLLMDKTQFSCRVVFNP